VNNHGYQRTNSLSDFDFNDMNVKYEGEKMQNYRMKSTFFFILWARLTITRLQTCSKKLWSNLQISFHL